MNKKKKIRVLIIGLFIVAMLIIGVFFREGVTSRGKQFVSFAFALKQHKDVVPELLPLRGSILHPFQQWEGEHGSFVLISQPEVVFYRQPDIGEFSGTLKISDRVRVLYIQPYQSKESKLNESSRWIFVGSEGGGKLYGWIKEDQVAYKNQFEPISDWVFESDFDFNKNNFKAHMTVYDNGRFQMNWKAQSNKIFLKGSPQGKMYQYDDLFWAKMAHPTIWVHFFYESLDSLYVERFYNDTPQKVRPN